MTMEFYTYGHYTESGRLFYIGKGKGNRAHSKADRNKHWNHIVSKDGLKVEVFAYWQTETEAFAHERLLISCFRDTLGFKLANYTDGGEGSSGFSPTEETRSKLSVVSKKNWQDQSFIEKMKVRSIGEFTDKKLKSSLVNAAAARAALMDPVTKAQAKLKNSEASLTNWTTPGYKERLSSVHKSLWTEDRKAQKSLQITGRVRMTDGVLERNVLPAEVDNLLKLGWAHGRKPGSLSKRSNPQ